MTGIDASMFELFREEVRAHADTLAAGLIALEATPTDPALLESLMRAAHSIKGAARIAGIDTAVRLAHVMEDALVAAQEGKIRLKPSDIDTLLKGADVLAGLAALTPNTIADWEANNTAAVAALEPLFVAMAAGKPQPPKPPRCREVRERPPTVPPPPQGERGRKAARLFLPLPSQGRGLGS